MALLSPLKKVLEMVRDVADEVAQGLPRASDLPPSLSPAARSPMDSARTVLVIYGRNERARKAMFDFLKALGLAPIEWSAARTLTGKPSPYIGEILDAAFRHAGAAVVLLTGDEEVRLRDPLRGERDPAESTALQARPNVFYEAGMAMGRAPERTVLVQLGPVRSFSDISGRHVVMLDNALPSRHELAEQLRLAKLDVNTSGLDWHSAGDFDGAVV